MLTVTNTVFVCLLLVFALATGLRNTVWDNDITVWADALAKSPNKARPHQNYGAALRNDWLKWGKVIRGGDIVDQIQQTHEALSPEEKAIWDEAKAHQIRALELEPQYAVAALALGKAYLEEADYDKALHLLTQVAEGTRYQKIRADAWYSIAVALYAKQMFGPMCVAMGKALTEGQPYAWYGYQRCLYHELDADLSGWKWAVWRWLPEQ